MRASGLSLRAGLAGVGGNRFFGASSRRADLASTMIGGLLAAILALGLSSVSPLLIPAFCLGTAALILAFVRPFWGLALALAVIPFERYALPTGVLQLTASDLLGISAAAGWLASRIVGNRAMNVPPLLFGPMLLLLCSFGPSIILAADPGLAIKQFVGWANFFVLFWMVAVDAGRREVRMIVVALAIAGGVAGVMTVISPTLDLFGRASGPFGQPNTLAQFVALAIPAQIYVLLRERHRLQLMAIGCIGVSIYALVFSLSRAGWAGILVVALMLLIWRRFRLALLGFAAVVFALAVIGFNPLGHAVDSGKVIDRVTGGSGSSSAEASALRHDIYGKAPKIIADHPLGVGANNFYTVAPDYQLSYFPFNASQTSSAENLVFGLGTEQGILAVIALFWLSGACLAVALALWRSEDAEIRALTLTLSAILVSQVVIGMFHYGFHSNPITLSTFVVIGCLAALARKPRREAPETEPSSDRSSPAAPVAASV